MGGWSTWHLLSGPQQLQNTFTYQWHANEYGTYWYHSHDMATPARRPLREQFVHPVSMSHLEFNLCVFTVLTKFPI